MLRLGVMISVFSISTVSVGGTALAFEPFCPVSSDLMKFREDLLTETVLQQTLDALRSGPPSPQALLERLSEDLPMEPAFQQALDALRSVSPSPEALLERPSEVDLVSITYYYNSETIIEGFRLRSVVQHRQAILELERLGGGGRKRESRVADAEAKFDDARKVLCSFLDNAKYAQ